MGANPFLPGLERYLHLEEGLSPRTAAAYRLDAALFLGYLEAQGVDWLRAGPREVRAFLQARGARPRRAGRLLAAIARFYRYLAEVEGLAVQDPTEGVKRPKLPRRLPVYLTPPEVRALLEAARAQDPPERALRDWALLAFLYGTGLRVSEALGLELGGVLEVEGRPAAVRVLGKGAKERIVPLSPTARGALEAWLARRRLVGGRRVWVHLEGRRRGAPINVRTVQLALKRAAERAGVDPARATPHKLRHAYASALVEAGRGVDEVKELLGHASVATTQVYVHTSRRRLLEAVRALPDVLGAEGA